MSRRLRQWLDATRAVERAYIYDGPKLAGWDGVRISVPPHCRKWGQCWIKVWVNNKLDHTEAVHTDVLLMNYYTLRRPDVPDGANVKMVIERQL